MRFIVWVLLLFLVAGSRPWAAAQTASTSPNACCAARITQAIRESERTTLAGNVPSLARAEFDRGPVDGSTKLSHLRLELARSSAQEAALETYLAELHDKSSPNYRHWLKPEGFGQRFGPSDADIATLTAWLESHGLTVERVSAGRTNIAFSGTAS